MDKLLFCYTIYFFCLFSCQSINITSIDEFNNHISQRINNIFFQLRVGYTLSSTEEIISRDARVKLTIQENNLPHAETLPGGQIVITTGFLDCMQYEAELAFVLAHEMGHVLGQHAERELALAGTPEGERGAQARRLRCELEADREGLLLMARAGYDPRVGLRFWQRFTSTPEAVLQQQLAGTHPSHEERMRALQSALPEAMQLYRRAEKQVGRGIRLGM